MKQSLPPNAYWVEPGRFAAGEYPGSIRPEDGRTKIRQLLASGIRLFLDLTETGELLSYTDILHEEADRIGADPTGIEVRWQRMPIQDTSTPSGARMAQIQATLADAIQGGVPVYVHCWGGVGRTGTVVGCFLVESGLSGREALARLHTLWQNVEKRQRRPRTPENSEQEQFVLAWKPAGGTAYEAAVESIPAVDRPARIEGCFLGGATGDALGATVEFMSLGEIRARFGPKGIADYAPAYGRTGAITDDTQMTLWTAEGLLRGHSRGTERGILHMSSVVHHAYLRWLKTQSMVSKHEAFSLAAEKTPGGWLIGVESLHNRRAPGNTCLSALMSAEMGSVERPINDSKGCGGVMRVAPAGLYADDPESAFALGCELAAITHGHPTGYLAAGCLAAVVAEIVRGNQLRAAIARAMEILARAPQHEETTASLTRALSLHDRGLTPTPEQVEQIGQGWIAEEALAIAVYCALAYHDDFHRAILLAVNHSGDSDSTGAITGNLLGALLGVDAIPTEWIESLELRPEIGEIAQDLWTRYRDDESWRQRYPGY